MLIRAMILAVFLRKDWVLCHPPNFGSTFFDRQFPGQCWSSVTRSTGSDGIAYKLPNHVTPKSYHLSLVPNLSDDFNFTGEVKIRIFVNENTKIVLLHSHELHVFSVIVTLGTKIFESTYSLLPLSQMLNITTRRELPYGNSLVVTIKFEGRLNDRNVGFYRSKYEINKKIKWLAVTQFEPTYARMAFPCFDEPQFRAEFTVSIARYKYQKVISNMPLKETSSPIKSLNNRVVDKFRTTPSMPTYILAFAVSEFPFIIKSRERFRLWARDDVIEDGRFALSLSEGFVQQFENFTRIRYDLPKLDFAVIPDLEPGAMENWGLLTFREPHILFNKKSRPAEKKETVVTALVHVLSHQWFGNSVTMASWDYLWLKEGFATYFEYFETAIKKPKWRMDEKFVTRVTHYALSIDGIHIHHAMNGNVNSPSEINELFDGISYHKAAAVIHMIKNFLTEELFERAIKIYFVDRISDGGIATPNDLYNVFELVRILGEKPMPKGLNLFVMMEQFADQVGYPLIMVTRHSNGDSTDIRIKQTPYRSPRSKKEIPDQVWTVPLACAKKTQYHMNNKEPSMWSFNKQEILLRGLVEEKEWYICNVQQTGYYRVNYDKESWNLIRDQLKIAPEEIHPVNRAQILDDSYTLALDEKLSFSMALSLLSYLKHELDPIPWYTGIEKLRHLYTQYEATSVAVDLKRVAVELVTNYYNFVGFDPKITDDQPTKEFRRTLTMVSCELDIPHCVSKSRRWFLYYGNDLQKIPDDIKETVLCTIMRIDSSTVTWNRFWNHYRRTNVASEKETILFALSCSSNKDLLKNYLFKLVNDQDGDIRLHNVIHVLNSILRFYRGVSSALMFIKDILPRINQFKKAKVIVLQLLNRMKFLVRSKEHEYLLDDSIEEAEKLDQQIYGIITVTLKDTKAATQSNIEENERRVSELSSAVSNYDRSNRKSRWSLYKSASVSIFIPTATSVSLRIFFIFLHLGANYLRT